ncbi:MAG: hemolysin family protein [Actinomycetota bacterium]
MESSTLSLIGFLILLALSAFSSAAETALTSVNRIKVKHMVEEKVSRAAILDALLERPTKFLATILLLNNLVNIGAASLAAVMAANLGLSYPAVISTGVVTFLVLVYGEITPKTFAAQNAERIALLVARPISLLCMALFPIARLFIFIANTFIRLFGGKTMKEGPFITEEELRTMVSVGEREGVIEEQEKEMIHSVFEFGDTVVREVMVPRMDMVCVDSNASLEEVLDLIAREKHSRIPVYEDTVDNIIGIIYSKDLLTQVAKGNAKISLKKLVRPVHYIPETKKVSELLRELQRRRQRMAIVVDEYGGTAGLVTIEDLLEEIVGEIYDEYDLEKVMIEQIDDNNIRVDARVNLDEVNEILGINLPDFECDTIGGFVYNLVGKIPSEGEKVDFEGLTFTVEKVIGRRISKILITKNPDKLESQSK